MTNKHDNQHTEKNTKLAIIPRTKKLEFGGILGVYFMIIGLPFGVYAINLLCNKVSCAVFSLSQSVQLSELFSVRALLIVFGWFLFQLVLYVIPTGYVAQGKPLNTGTRLTYRCNAFFSLHASVLLLFFLAFSGVPIQMLYHELFPLITAATIMSFIISILLFIKARRAPNHALAVGGNSGNAVYDFFLGHELNPRTFQIDWKFFCELRPGLIGWIGLDVAYFIESYHQHGRVDYTLLLVISFHMLYVVDALWHEEAILTTMDIVHDGFGFMLVFGDLVWVPFLYSLQARYLLEHPQQWSGWFLGLFFALNGLGYAIFRCSNSEKNAFRSNPNQAYFKDFKTLKTSSGSRLLLSGWWGVSRHPNYLGDLVMGLSWSLPCGFSSVLPYFYPIYFLCLLTHRSLRDEAICRRKYGKDWDRYCSIVRYRIFPFIY